MNELKPQPKSSEATQDDFSDEDSPNENVDIGAPFLNTKKKRKVNVKG